MKHIVIITILMLSCTRVPAVEPVDKELIWVDNAALRCGKGKEGVTNVVMRKRFYPGANYVDIVSIDIYPNESHGHFVTLDQLPKWKSPK